jgi:hypothetical protein
MATTAVLDTGDWTAQCWPLEDICEQFGYSLAMILIDDQLHLLKPIPRDDLYQICKIAGLPVDHWACGVCRETGDPVIIESCALDHCVLTPTPTP